MRKIRFFAVFVCFLLFIAGIFSPVNAANKQTSYKFEVLSTTDMHGRATSHDVASGKEDNNSMVRVATVVKKERTIYGDRLILIDNGDLLQGTLVSEYALSNKKDLPNPMISALIDLKYDVWVMGNHEFNYSPEQRNPQIKYALEAGIAVLGGNIVLKQDGYNMNNVKVLKGAPYFSPFTIKTIDFGNNKKVRVAIIGLGNANNANWDRECNYPNMQFNSIDNPDGILEKEINKWVKIIQDKNLADIIIVSAHSGKTNDTNVQTTKFMKESQAVSGAKNSHGIALLIYGHDHSQNIEKLTNADGNDIYIVNGGGTSVTRNVFDVSFDKDNKFSGYTMSADAINLCDVKNDKAFGKKLEYWYYEAYDWASKPFGTFSGGWDKYKDETSGKTNNDLVLTQTQINNFIHKVQLWASWRDYEKNGREGAKVSITSSILAVNPDGTIAFIPQDGKEVSTLELSKIYRFSNNLLCMADMSAKQLYGWMSAVADKLAISEDGKPVIKADESLHGVDTFYGIDYIFDISKPLGHRVVSAKINGVNLLDMKEPIRVVLNTYRMSGCHGFYEAVGLKESDCVWESSQSFPGENASIQALLGEYFKQHGKVTPYEKAVHGYNSVWKIITK